MRATGEELDAQMRAASAAAALLPRIPADPGADELRRTLAPTDAEFMEGLASDAAAAHSTSESAIAQLADDAQRAALFAVSAPELAPHLERLWARGREFETPSSGAFSGIWSIDPPRTPSPTGPAADERAAELLIELLRLGRRYRVDLSTLLRWSDRLDGAGGALGSAVAFAIDAGDGAIRGVLDDLLTAGNWNTALCIALLRQRDPAAWTRAHEVLLAAGREEGLREQILRCAGEAGPEAFAATLQLVVDQDLYRFPSVIAVAARWLSVELAAPDRERNGRLLAEAALLVQDGAAREARLAGDGDSVWRALCAAGVHSIPASIDRAVALLEDPDPARRSGAVAHLRLHHAEPGVREHLVRALDDPDLGIAFAASQRLNAWINGGWREGARLGDAGARLFLRLPAKPQDIPAPNPLHTEQASRSSLVWALSREPGVPSLPLLVDHIAELNSDARALIVSTHGARLAEQHREALLALIGDASPSVRDGAFDAVRQLELTDDEARALEPLLRRKAGDLRAGVLDLIVRGGDARVREAADRLVGERVAALQLAGVELLDRLAGSADSSVATASLRRLESLRDSTKADVRLAVERALDAHSADQEPVEDDGFGLFDPGALTAIVEPVDRGIAVIDEPTLRVVAALQAFVDEHARDPIEIAIPDHDEPRTRRLIALDRETSARWPAPTELMRQVNDVVDAALGDAARGTTLMRASLLTREGWHGSDMTSLVGPAVAGTVRAVPARVLGTRRPSVKHWGTVGGLLAWLLDEHETSDARDLLLDVTEAILTVPLESPDPSVVGEHVVRMAMSHGRAPRLREALDRLERTHGAWSDDQLARLWRLMRWVVDADPPTLADCFEHDHTRERRSARITHRPDLTSVLILHARGVMRDADLIDHLIGPRDLMPNWSQLDELVGRWYPWLVRREPAPTTLAVATRARDRLVEVELTRGEAPTRATAPVLSVSNTGGMEVFLTAARALGRQSLQRGASAHPWTFVPTMSHLVRASSPRDGETPERFAELARDHDLPRTRLIELACYAPQWAAHIEAALGAPGFADGVWWVYAHTNDDQWDHHQRELSHREIAARSELELADFADGAVDVEWFGRVRAQLGPKLFLEELLGAARYVTTGGGHKRADLFARALESKVPLKELRDRIAATRHQDSVRALGLRPLSARRREADLRERWQLLARFRRESTQFGSQRQESERRALDIGLANLARTAGYRDPLRLAWAMDAASTADLTGHGVTLRRDDVAVSLRADDRGHPQLEITRNGRRLKAVPAPLKKDREVAALLARQTELRRATSRARDGLEQAMVRGDRFTGAELHELRAHVVVWPQLRELLVIRDEPAATTVGRLTDDATAVSTIDGSASPLADAELWRIAHPLDLLASGTWAAWQRQLFHERRRQPFKQAFRELYLPVNDEQVEGWPGWSRRYAGHQVRERSARALLTKRGWACPQYDPPMRTLRAEGLIATVEVLDGWGTPLEVEPPVIDAVVFRDTAGEAVALSDVPPRIFSEVMRDLDLVVSVAHAFDVDPEASMSTVEARAVLVRESAALLGLPGITIDGKRVLVNGRLGRYTVHLGSAVVTREPGGALCIVPVPAQSRGRIYLPFADDDPRSAEVLSKVLLLVRDDEIRDPAIRAQLGI